VQTLGDIREGNERELFKAGRRVWLQAHANRLLEPAFPTPGMYLISEVRNSKQPSSDGRVAIPESHTTLVLENEELPEHINEMDLEAFKTPDTVTRKLHLELPIEDLKTSWGQRSIEVLPDALGKVKMTLVEAQEMYHAFKQYEEDQKWYYWQETFPVQCCDCYGKANNRAKAVCFVGGVFMTWPMVTTVASLAKSILFVSPIFANYNFLFCTFWMDSVMKCYDYYLYSMSNCPGMYKGVTTYDFPQFGWSCLYATPGCMVTSVVPCLWNWMCNNHYGRGGCGCNWRNDIKKEVKEE